MQKPHSVVPEERRILAVVSHFNWQHIDYLLELGRFVDLRVVVAGEASSGAVSAGVREGLRIASVGVLGRLDLPRLQKIIDDWRPCIIHVMYYYNEELTILVRRLANKQTVVVHESRDPLSTLLTEASASKSLFLERHALRASDGQIFVSQAVCNYLERTHNLDLSATSIVVPHSFAERTISPPSTKLSTQSRRRHLALMGTVSPHPDDGRYYVTIIRRLVSLGLVVHSHFFENPGESNHVYRELDSELEDYHYHPTLSDRNGTRLSERISQYDLMGVFYEGEATRNNVESVLAVSMPTKAACGWLHGGLPVVCFPQCGGLVELIRELKIGFIIKRWEDLSNIAADSQAISQATEACLRHRHRFTHEWNVQRIMAFYSKLVPIS